MITASISMRGVGRRYGATVALAGVDLDLESGVIGLHGPNGAGKTTLLRLLATALPPTGGEIRVLGRDPQVPAQRTDIRRRLGYLPQEAGFPRGFTASAFIDYIALLKEWAEALPFPPGTSPRAGPGATKKPPPGSLPPRTPPAVATGASDFLSTRLDGAAHSLRGRSTDPAS